MADELIENAEFGRKRKNEEEPILIAQRFLNIYRQMHIFNKSRQEQFDDMLLELSPDIRILLSTLPGGSLLLEHIEELEQKRGLVSFSHKKGTPLGPKNTKSAEKDSAAVEKGSGKTSSSVIIDASFASELSASLSIALQQTERRYKDDIKTLTETITQSIMQSQTAIANMMKDILTSAKNARPFNDNTAQDMQTPAVPQPPAAVIAISGQQENKTAENNLTAAENSSKSEQTMLNATAREPQDNTEKTVAAPAIEIPAVAEAATAPAAEESPAADTITVENDSQIPAAETQSMAVPDSKKTTENKKITDKEQNAKPAAEAADSILPPDISDTAERDIPAPEFAASGETTDSAAAADNEEKPTAGFGINFSRIAQLTNDLTKKMQQAKKSKNENKKTAASKEKIPALETPAAAPDIEPQAANPEKPEETVSVPQTELPADNSVPAPVLDAELPAAGPEPVSALDNELLSADSEPVSALDIDLPAVAPEPVSALESELLTANSENGQNLLAADKEISDFDFNDILKDVDDDLDGFLIQNEDIPADEKPIGKKADKKAASQKTEKTAPAQPYQNELEQIRSALQPGPQPADTRQTKEKSRESGSAFIRAKDRTAAKNTAAADMPAAPAKTTAEAVAKPEKATAPDTLNNTVNPVPERSSPRPADKAATIPEPAAKAETADLVSLDEIPDSPVSLDVADEFLPVTETFVQPAENNGEQDWEWEYTEDSGAEGDDDDWEWEYVEDDGSLDDSDDWEWEYVEEDEPETAEENPETNK